MRERWRLVAGCSLVWLLLANGLPAYGWPGGGNQHDDKKDAQGPKKLDPEIVKSCISDSSWIAYFKGPDGTLAPVRNTLNSEHDEDWLGLQFTYNPGPRIRLGVLSVVNKAAEADSADGKERLAVPAAGIQEMLTAALYNTRRFDVIEQQRVDEIKRQQTRTDTVALPPSEEPTPVKTEESKRQTRKGAAALHSPPPTPEQNAGRVLGVQYLVYATVNEWTPDRTSSSTGGQGLLSHIPGANLLGQPTMGKSTAEVAITFTLADVGSGQVLYTTAQRARLGESHVDLGGTGGSATSGKLPVNYAVAACTNKAAYEIAKYLKSRQWNGSIVAKFPPDYYVNSGSQGGMTVGAMLRVKSVIRKVVDPETHTIIGEDTRGNGTITVYKTDANFSVAHVAEKALEINVGDRVEVDSKAAPTPERPECLAAEASPDH